jgi:hypothetical protein
MENVPVAKPNYRMNWYNAHKNEDEFMQKMRDNKRRYYLNNKEKIKTKNLLHYYEKKALATAEVVSE